MYKWLIVQESQETHERKRQTDKNITNEFQLLAYYFAANSFDEELNQMKNISQTTQQFQKIDLLVSIKNLQKDLKTRQRNIQVKRPRAHDVFFVLFLDPLGGYTTV